jgi:serine/threonine-protein kinase
MNLAGQLLAGKYQLKNRLGQGTMGTVYLATQIKLKRDVAVKILNTDSDIYRTRFEREAKTAASLTHPHIVSIFDYGIEGDIHYVAMPYISGGTLAKRYTNSLKIPTLFETITIISQVASALDHAHSRGIVHRDVKPSNIMTDEQGNAFLADFGIVRLLETTYTLGKPMGTPPYMPPEQWDNTTDLSQAADQYALAVMTF